jgi:hypothetical protein
MAVLHGAPLQVPMLLPTSGGFCIRKLRMPNFPLGHTARRTEPFAFSMRSCREMVAAVRGRRCDSVNFAARS